MSDFMAEMHQIRFRPGLCPDLAEGDFTALLRQTRI